MGYQFEIYELMIARQWSGWAPKERAPEYLNLFSGQVQPKLNAIRGFRRSLVLVREHGEETEIVTITFFERLEDIVAFAIPFGRHRLASATCLNCRKIKSRRHEKHPAQLPSASGVLDAPGDTGVLGDIGDIGANNQ